MQFYRFPKTCVPGIHGFFVLSEDIIQVGTFLENHFARLGTVKGTRSNHCFIPTGKGTLQVSMISCLVPTISPSACQAKLLKRILLAHFMFACMIMNGLLKL